MKIAVLVFQDLGYNTHFQTNKLLAKESEQYIVGMWKMSSLYLLYQDFTN